MKRYVYALDLKDDPALMERYLAHHRAVWPEVIAAVRRIGVVHDTIYQLGTRLVMILEADDDFDPARDLQKYAEDPRAREWDELMRTFQQPVPGAPPDDWWGLMTNVFDLDEYRPID